MASPKPLGTKSTNSTPHVELLLPSGATFRGDPWLGLFGPNYKPNTMTLFSPPAPSTQKRGTKRKSDSTNDSTPPTQKRTKKQAQSNSSSSNYPKDANNLTDVSSVELEGDYDATVPVYATAADIRRQLTTLLQTPGVSQAGLCRTLSAASGTPVTPRHLTTFRGKGKKGAAAVDGADSPAFYGAWAYLEKVRVLTGGKKSKHRLEMEEHWGPRGMSRAGLAALWLGPGDTLDYDKFGRMIRNGQVSDTAGAMPRSRGGFLTCDFMKGMLD